MNDRRISDAELNECIELLEGLHPINGQTNEQVIDALKELASRRKEKEPFLVRLFRKIPIIVDSLKELINRRDDDAVTVIPESVTKPEEMIPSRKEYEDTDDGTMLHRNFRDPKRMYRFRPKTKRNLFVDMDGVLAYWRKDNERYVDYFGKERDFHTEHIYSYGYYFILPPECEGHVLDAIKLIIKNKEQYGIDEVYIASSVPPDGAHKENDASEAVWYKNSALADKRLWIRKYLPEMKDENCIFMPWGRSKTEFINLADTECNILLDDYTDNLIDFEKQDERNIGVKLLNGKNGTNGKWASAGGEMVYGSRSPEEIADAISSAFLRRYESHLR